MPELSAVMAKDLVLKIVEIFGDDIHTTVLFKIVVLRFNIWCFIIIIFLLVHYLIDIIFKDEYSRYSIISFVNFVNIIYVPIFKINIIRWS